MIDPAVLDAMLAAGASADVIVAAVKADQAKDEARREAKRANNAERQQRYRDRHNASNALRDVTDVTPPTLDKETSPRPPKEINPTPRACPALARKAAGFGPPADVDLGLWNQFVTQRKKPLAPKAYEMITDKLAEGAEAGWPPGDLVSRAIERGWETIFIPDGKQNGRTNRMAGTGQRDPDRSRDGFINAIRDSRANREAVPWASDDPGGMRRIAVVG